MSLPLFSGLWASLMAATVFAPDTIPTCVYNLINKNKNKKKIRDN